MTVFWILLFALSPQPHEVALKLPNDLADQPSAWSLRLEDGRTLKFDASGSLVFDHPGATTFFEVIDAQGHVRLPATFEGFAPGAVHLLPVSRQAPQPTTEMTMVVSAGRHLEILNEQPREITVIKPSDQKERTTSQTSDWLKEEAEVLLQKTNLGGGSPIIRGMSGNRVLLMVDGFRLNNATFRLGLNQYLNTVPGNRLDQVEVMMGPSGVMYGSDGLGGTVHLRTLDADAGPKGFDYEGSWSSADNTQSHTLEGSYQFGDLSIAGHVTFNDYADLRSADGPQVPTAYSTWDGSFQVQYRFDDMSRLRFMNLGSTAENVPRTDRILAGKDLLWEYSPQNFNLNGVRYDKILDQSFADYLDFGYAYSNNYEGTRRISTKDPDRLEEERADVDTHQVDLTLSGANQGWDWSYGFDAQWDQVAAWGRVTDLTSNTVTGTEGKFPNDGEYRAMGAFAMVKRRLTDSQNIRFGLRYTDFWMTGTLDEPIGKAVLQDQHLTPSLYYNNQRGPWQVAAGISQGFRAPNLEDALSAGFSNKGFDAPNPNLGAEQLWNYEIGIRYRNPLWHGGITLYTSRYDNLIERVPGSYQGQTTYQGEPVFMMDNVGRAKIDGLNLDFATQLAANLKLSGDLAWTRGTQLTDNLPMTRIPPLRGNLRLNYQRQRYAFSSIFTWAARQDRLSPGDLADSRIPEDGTPGYAVLHLRGRYQFNNHVTLNAGLENITNQLYKSHGSGIYEPGRRLMLRLQVGRW